MRKYILTGVVVAGVILGGIAYGYMSKPIVYENPIKTITNEVIKEVNPLDEQVKQREMELEEKYRTMQSLQARIDVTKAEIERLTAQVTADQKELASFTTATTSKR
jgi:peptidoglycan hydrolase CwlO-like protein